MHPLTSIIIRFQFDPVNDKKEKKPLSTECRIQPTEYGEAEEKLINRQIYSPSFKRYSFWQQAMVSLTL